MTNNKFLEAALGYAEKGWAVFPCKPRGKTPLTEHGCLDASRDTAQIRAWWEAKPTANVGIACGPSRLVVIDLDGKKGQKSWSTSRKKHGFDDNTLASVTGGDGVHLLFQAPTEHSIPNSAGRLGPGVDVRGIGGYIIAPPSVHPSGKAYAWDDACLQEPQPLPAPVMEAILRKKREKAAQIGEAIPEGQRNSALASAAGTMRRRGMSGREIRAALDVMNEDRCHPPLSDKEVEAIARSVAQYPASSSLATGAPPPEELFEGEPTMKKNLTTQDALRAKFRQADDLLSREPPKVDWVVDNAIEAGGFPVIFGDSGIGKSWLAMHLADCVATGRPWFGRSCKKRTVLYLDAENGEGLIHRRARAVCHPGGDLIFVSFPGFTLDNGGVVLVEWLIQETGAELLILDPLMNFLTGDENSIEFMKPQLTRLHEIGHSMGCTTMAVHHEGKSKSYRGSTGIKDICTQMMHLVVSEAGEANDFEHVLDVRIEKQREATLRNFSLVWFVENGRFHTGGLEKMRESPRALVADACAALMLENMKWPGKDELIKAKKLHGLTRKRAGEGIAQAIMDHTLEFAVGPHNRHEIRVVGHGGV